MTLLRALLVRPVQPNTMGLALYPTMWDNRTVRYAFVEAGNFSRSRDNYFRTDSDFAVFQVFLLRNPQAGAVIPGAGGLRKVRWAGEGTGKSGGLRIIYLHLPELHHIYLLDVYSKGEQADLSPEDRRLLAALAHDYQASLHKPTP